MFVFANKSNKNETKLLLSKILKTKYNDWRLSRRRLLHHHHSIFLRSLLFSTIRLVLSFFFYSLFALISFSIFLFVRLRIASFVSSLIIFFIFIFYFCVTPQFDVWFKFWFYSQKTLSYYFGDSLKISFIFIRHMGFFAF